MLPPTIPIFPLPNVVLFPNVFLPLHIFEPRYRAMLADALTGDRIIGMTLLMPGYEADYQGRPPVYAVGCAGVITHSERLPDGRSNVVLRGIEKFRILEEDTSREYRVARIEPLSENASDEDKRLLKQRRNRLEALVFLKSALRMADRTTPEVGTDYERELIALCYSFPDREARIRAFRDRKAPGSNS